MVFRFSAHELAQMTSRFQQLCPEFTRERAALQARELADQIEEYPEIAAAYAGAAWEAVDQEVDDWNRWAREAKRK